MLLPDPEDEDEAIDDGDGDHEVPDRLLAVVLLAAVAPGHLEDDVAIDSVHPDQIDNEEIAHCKRED